MHHEAGTLSTSDGLSLATRCWLPHDHPKAAVLLVHGLSEHSGRYAHVATHLMLHDYAVYSYDHRGHGRSEGTPRAYIDRFEALTEDLARVVEWVHAEAPGLPLFLLGHSMGGAVAARYVVEHGMDDLAGLVLSSAALKIPADMSPFLQRISGIVQRLAPTLPTTRLKRPYLSRDPAVGRAYEADPLTYKGGIRARTGYQILENTRDLLEHTEAFTGPLFLFHGTADRLTDPAGTQALYDAAPSDDKELRLYEDFLHETMNELDRDQVLGHLTDWLNARVPASTSADAERAAGGSLPPAGQ